MSEQFFFHLRGYRKRANLTQNELAYLMGLASGNTISFYEIRRRGYNLENALHLQAVFQTPLSELFADHYTKVELEIINRARVLHAAIKCEGCNRCRDCFKRVFLRNLIDGVPPPAPTSIWNKPKNTPPSLP